MRKFGFVFLALLALMLAAPTQQAEACNGVVQLQGFSSVFPIQVGFGVPAPLTVFQIQDPRNVFFLRNQRPPVTEIRSFTGPFGLFNRTVIRQR